MYTHTHTGREIVRFFVRLGLFINLGLRVGLFFFFFGAVISGEELAPHRSK